MTARLMYNDFEILDLYTVGSDTIFSNIYERTPRGPRGVKNRI